MSNEFGPGHYGNTGEVEARPTPIATGKGSDRWFAQCDMNGEGGTNIDEMFLNHLVATLRQSVRTAGAQQSELSEVMVAEAMARYGSGGQYYTDGGSANYKVLGGTGNFVVPKGGYFSGEAFTFIPTSSNTGATTFNANSRGVKKILNWDGTALEANALRSGRPASGIYSATADAGAGAMLLFPWSPTQRPHFEIAESAVQTLAAGVATRYTNMNTVVRNFLLSGSISSSRVTLGVREGGLWLINWQTNVVNDVDEQVRLHVNGQPVHLPGRVVGGSTVQLLTWVGYLTAGDELEWWGYHDAAGSRDTDGSNRALGIRLSTLYY